MSQKTFQGSNTKGLDELNLWIYLGRLLGLWTNRKEKKGEFVSSGPIVL